MEWARTGGSGGGGLDEEQDRLRALDEELEALGEQMQKLQNTRKGLLAEKRKLEEKARARVGSGANPYAEPTRQTSTTNYLTTRFSWSAALLPKARSVWKIEAFRSVQEAVCNAALDGRDVVCVMPTGGGKSLCYQLPALLSNGLTLVVSPLISLSMDQMWHLREANITCEMLYSAASREDSNDVLRRIKMGDAHNEIKVLFVTPERVAKSKTLLAALQKCYERDCLSRIVIDEAHCCSQMGHDFRPDYKNLSILRKIFPEVPFLCLSATLAPAVLEDVRQILNLLPVVDPADAPPQGTVYFTAPLHRPNLHYQVINRPSSAKDANQAIADYILHNHAGKSGTVYTFSKADTQRMADALNELSSGRIRASVYHADLEDAQKTRIHHKWRQGSIDVVVATIAFGMGIDKGDVRFVLHASLGKSLDSYYQETGRAGRDGKEADCVLFYRPADASRISGLLAGDPRGQEKLHSMLEYAQSAACRKSLFGHYFSDQYGGAAACGACDNCHSPAELTNATVEAWKLVRVIEEVYEEGGRITLAGLGDLSRGLGGGQYSVVDSQQRKRKKQRVKAKQSGFLDLAEVAGGKVMLSKDDTERVLIELLLKGFLADEFNATAYMVNVYVRPGPMSGRLTRLGLHDVESGVKGCPMVQVKLIDAKRQGGRRYIAKSAAHSTSDHSNASGSSRAPLSRNGAGTATKRKTDTLAWQEDSDPDFEDDVTEGGPGASSMGSSNRMDPIEIDSD